MAPIPETTEPSADLLARAHQRIREQDFIIRAQQIFIAWEAGDLSEGQACKALGMERVKARELKADAAKLGVMHAEDIREEE